MRKVVEHLNPFRRIGDARQDLEKCPHGVVVAILASSCAIFLNFRPLLVGGLGGPRGSAGLRLDLVRDFVDDLENRVAHLGAGGIGAHEGEKQVQVLVIPRQVLFRVFDGFVVILQLQVDARVVFVHARHELGVRVLLRELVEGRELFLRVVRAVDGQHQMVFIGADGNGKAGAGLLGPKR